MWRILAAAGIDTDRHDLGYPPHVTLAIYPDDTPEAALEAAFAQLTQTWQTLPLTLSGFGVFPGPSPILWAAPVVTRDLLARHATVCDAFPNLPVHPHYRPDSWVPHVTLAGGIQGLDRAIAVLLPGWRSVSGFLNQADLLRFRPVHVLRSRALPSRFGG